MLVVAQSAYRRADVGRIGSLPCFAPLRVCANNCSVDLFAHKHPSALTVRASKDCGHTDLNVGTFAVVGSLGIRALLLVTHADHVTQLVHNLFQQQHYSRFRVCVENSQLLEQRHLCGRA